MTDRDEFFGAIRQALDRGNPDGPPVPRAGSVPGADPDEVAARSQAIRERVEAEAGPLMDALAETAANTGWNVARCGSLAEVGDYVINVAREIEASLVVRSRQDVVDGGVVEHWLEPLGVQVVPMALGEGLVHSGDELRSLAERADIGITGVDYAIAETGSCVLIPSGGVSRVVSLLPPVHIAIVELGQVLPSLDELFTLRRTDFLEGNLGSYMNLITGPSRSADIEYKLVTGVHGPGEVHMVLVG